MVLCRASRRSAANSHRNENGKPRKNYPLSAQRKRQAEEELSALRTENAALRQSKAIADRDRSDLFEQLQKAERRAKGKEQAFGMVIEMLAAYPDEFDALLNKSRAKNAAPSFKSHGNDRGGK